MLALACLGASWGPSTRVPAPVRLGPAAISGYGGVIGTDAGFVLAMESGSRSWRLNDAVAVRFDADGGRRDAAPLLLTPGTPSLYAWSPSIACVGDGCLATWNACGAGGLQVASWSPATGAVGVARRVSTDCSVSGRVALTRDGAQGAVVWRNGAGAQLRLVAPDGTLGAQVTPGPGPANSPEVLGSGAGFAMVWLDGQTRVTYRRVTAAGGLGTAVTSTAGQFDDRPALATDHAIDVVAWGTAAGAVVLQRFDVATGVAVDAAPVTLRNGADPGGVRLAMFGAGSLLVTWYENYTSELWAMVLDRGSLAVTTPPAVRATRPGGFRQSSLAMVGARALVGWTEPTFTNFGRQLVLPMTVSPTTISVGPAMEATAASNDVHVTPTVVVADGGVVVGTKALLADTATGQVTWLALDGTSASASIDAGVFELNHSISALAPLRGGVVLVTRDATTVRARAYDDAASPRWAAQSNGGVSGSTPRVTTLGDTTTCSSWAMAWRRLRGCSASPTMAASPSRGSRCLVG